jgi:uncharacterized protein YndB with AHSA1/START domain
MTTANTNSTEKEIVTTRILDNPRELVFKAWTSPEHLINWWGPKGFKNTFHEFNLIPEGDWKFTMHGPNGDDFFNHSVFEEIVINERVVFRHLTTHFFRVVTTFEDTNGKTKLTFKMQFESKEECEKVKLYAVEANEQNIDRLEEELANMTLPQLGNSK